MTLPAPAHPELPLSQEYRTAALSARKPQRFDLAPDAATRAAVAAALDITAVHALRFSGEIRPSGKHDFVLEAELRAEVEQPCSVSLVPVRTRITEPVLRRYLADYAPPEGDEVEMPEDDSAEPLPEVIDAGAVAVEALALALPTYPRAAGVELSEASVAPPGMAPLRDADLRPFASLAGLRDKLSGGTDDTPPEGGGAG